jgi:glycerol-3-phosphate dehydrogenase
MKRDLAQLSQHAYDMLIIGGGIYGAWVAWDAALRGLSVALLEKGDLGHATSANSLRIIHGGLRYLQHGDIRRVRQSIYERKVLMRVAPHLVHPLPFLIPAYGHAMRSKAVLGLALAVNDLIGFDRNHRQDPQHYIPRGRIISRDECLRRLPGVDRDGLTGGAIFYDGQVADTERLVLSLARSAVRAGAHMANYVEVTGLLAAGGRMAGVRATDVSTGETLDIRASTVVNAAGPWRDQVLTLLDGRRPRPKMTLSKTFNLLVKRQLFTGYAVGVYSKRRFQDRDALISKGARLYFITPWHGRSLIGTAHLPYADELDRVEVTEAEAQAFLDEINAAYPAAGLKPRDICLATGGLLPVASYGEVDVRLSRRAQILDHSAEGGLEGLISVSGVKFTEARRVAEKAVDLAFRKLGRTPPHSATAMTPVHGGGIEQFSAFVDQEMRKTSQGLSREAIRYLIRRYGAEYPRVLRYFDLENTSPPAIAATPISQVSSSPPGRQGKDTGLSCDGEGLPCNEQTFESLLEAEVRHAVREEMARKLADVVFRRTTLGVAGDPGDARLRACAAIMAGELGWDACRTQRDIEEVRTAFSRRSHTP